MYVHSRNIQNRLGVSHYKHNPLTNSTSGLPRSAIIRQSSTGAAAAVALTWNCPELRSTRARATKQHGRGGCYSVLLAPLHYSPRFNEPSSIRYSIIAPRPFDYICSRRTGNIGPCKFRLCRSLKSLDDSRAFRAP